MATLHANGQALIVLVSPSGKRYSFHSNGHILVRLGDGWRQWCIVPIDGMGSVVDYLKSRGFTTV